MAINKLIILKNKEEAARRAAEIFVEAIQRKPNLVLGLPTGKTFVPIYREIVKLCGKKKISFAGVKTFNLDEYFGLKFGDKRSFRYYMNRNFFSKAGMGEGKIFMLNGDVKDFRRECLDYEREIRKAGGIDLLFLGIGLNGHIGFNEPGSSFASRTRRVKLTESTRKSNAVGVPGYALTMGIGTILGARKIVLVATGRNKSLVVRKIINGEITTRVPASALRRHKNTTVILDKDAASGLKNNKKI
ncbi:glucosamine-6-phosphate deaminase [Candidatus Pacearchaeota archaeon]|nr:glucosamine-6-phosphate deaminase [Candidatus Pacearchaeota archaeon]